MARVVLVGLPGVGKTSVAQALSSRWGCPVLDTDEEFQNECGRTASQFLVEEGEAAFRECEVRILRRALDGDVVVATGGGVVTSPAARELLTHEVTLWLDCDDEVILARVIDTERPLLGEDHALALANLRERRQDWYEGVSRARIDASGTLDEVIEQVARRVGEVSS